MALFRLQELSPGPRVKGTWDYHNHWHHLYLSAALYSREAWDRINQVTSKYSPHLSRLMEAWIPTPHCWRECLWQLVLGSGVDGGVGGGLDNWPESRQGYRRIYFCAGHFVVSRQLYSVYTYIWKVTVRVSVYTRTKHCYIVKYILSWPFEAAEIILPL